MPGLVLFSGEEKYLGKINPPNFLLDRKEKEIAHMQAIACM